MDKFQDLNFNVVATDNATKVLKDVLDVLNKLEKKFNAFSKITMPNLDLTKDQVSLLKNWNKLDSQLKQVEKDLNKIGKVQKEIQKFEIVPKGKRPFNYDSGSKRYVDNNIALIKREQKAISDVFKGNQLLLPAPSSATLKAESLRQAHQIEDELSDYWSKQYLVNINKKTKFPYQALQYESGHGVAQLPEGFVTNENEAVEEYLKARKQINKELKEVIKDTNEIVSSSSIVNKDEKEISRKESIENELKELKGASAKYEDALKKLKIAKLKYEKVVEKVGLKPRKNKDKVSLESAKYNLQKAEKAVQIAELQKKLEEENDGDDKNKESDDSKLQKAMKKTKKFANSIGRIIVYRIIRSAMAEIKKAVVASSEELAKASEQYNKTMSKVSTSAYKIKYSLGLILQPFLEAISPGLENIADLFVQLANYMSYINALEKGSSDYIQINSEYTKDWVKSLKEANNLLSFDKFEVLQKTEEKDIYKKANVKDGIDASQNIMDIGNFIKDGADTLKEVVEILGKILDVVSSMSKPFDSVSKASGGILDIVSGLSDLNLKSILGGVLKLMTSAIKPIVKSLDFVVTIMVDTFNLIYNFWIWIRNMLTPGKENDLEYRKLYNIFKGETFNIGGFNSNEVFDSFYDSIDDWVNGKNLKDSVDDNIKERYENKDSSETSKTNIVVDFKNVNNNAIARELAQPIADQLKKQNIKVTYS